MRKEIVLIALASSLLVSCSKAPAEDTKASSSETTAAVETSDSIETSAEESQETSASSESEKKAGSIEDLSSFELKSGDLKDGVWANVISKTDIGENKSPDLTWEPVEGAGLYVIYMVDETAGNWIHWRSDGVTETTLPEGWAKDSDYIGPYPPPGTTHVYTVYVVALKNPVERVRGLFNGDNPRFTEFFLGLDTDASGNTGNIISYGRLSGEFTNP